MKLNFIAPINFLSYGISSTHIVHELINLGHEVALFPIGKPECHFRHADSIRQAILNADSYNVHAPCIRLWHQFDLSMFVGKGTHIGFPIFELDTFTDKEKHHIASCDGLFVCSEWAKSVVQKDIVDKFPHGQFGQICNTASQACGLNIKVVPLGVDTSAFTPTISKRKPTIFLNVGKWEVRKGHLELLHTFCSAFDYTDNVELWMLSDNLFLTEEERQGWVNYYKNSPLGNKIRIIPHVESDYEVGTIMRQADCGVFLSHAEGFNLPALEMLACGKQVIATNYSAHTEFLTTENSWPVPIFGIEPAYDRTPWMPNNKWFHGQGNWASLPHESTVMAANHMRLIHETKQNGGLELNQAGVNTANRLTWKNTALKIVESL